MPEGSNVRRGGQGGVMHVSSSFLVLLLRSIAAVWGCSSDWKERRTIDKTKI